MRAYKDSTVSSRPAADSTRMVGSGSTLHLKVEPVSGRYTPPPARRRLISRLAAQVVARRLTLAEADAALRARS